MKERKKETGQKKTIETKLKNEASFFHLSRLKIDKNGQAYMIRPIDLEIVFFTRTLL